MLHALVPVPPTRAPSSGADFTGDGLLDLLVLHRQYNWPSGSKPSNALYVNVGGTGFSLGAAPITYGHQSMALGDINNGMLHAHL